MKNNIYFHTLGCSKNDVDTKSMSSILKKDKYNVVTDPYSADAIIINTCGFIEAAKEESIDAIVNFAQLKNENLKKLILAGCLAQRYADDLVKEIPEIDGIIGTGKIADVNNILDEVFKDNLVVKTDDINSPHLENLREYVSYSEYVKISEGCDNNCTYCIIPKLRGKNRSRSIEDIYKEVEYLVENGTREIILLAQNTTDYGIDIYGKYSLYKLLRELKKIEKLNWMRVLYLYPDHFNDELIEEFKTNEKLIKYVDIPLQHHSDKLLKRMNRKTTSKDIENLIDTLRREIPDITIRTTYILGFPGESDEDFKELIGFVKKAKFDKLGAFTYSREEDTPAYNMANQVLEEVKEARYNELMEVQKSISEKNLEKKIGKILDVLIEEKIDERTYAGRSEFDIPEIDGQVFVSTDKDLKLYDFVKVKITDSMEYDLIGELYELTK